jgi:hypothetical protein
MCRAMKISHTNPAGFPGLLIVISVMVGFFSLFTRSTVIVITATVIAAGMAVAGVRTLLAKQRAAKRASGILGL